MVDTPFYPLHASPNRRTATWSRVKSPWAKEWTAGDTNRSATSLLVRGWSTMRL